jgi:hypothetical protein
MGSRLKSVFFRIENSRAVDRRPSDEIRVKQSKGRKTIKTAKTNASNPSLKGAVLPGTEAKPDAQSGLTAAPDRSSIDAQSLSRSVSFAMTPLSSRAGALGRARNISGCN